MQVIVYIKITWQKLQVRMFNLLFWIFTIKWYNKVDVFFKTNDVTKKTIDNSLKYKPSTNNSPSENSHDYKPKISQKKQKFF